MTKQQMTQIAKSHGLDWTDEEVLEEIARQVALAEQAETLDQVSALFE